MTRMRRQNRMIDAFILDFDGLICDTEGALAEAGRKLFASHGAELPMDRWLQQIGLAGPANFWVPWLEQAIGREVDEAEAMAASDRHNHSRLATLEPNPGVVALLDLEAARRLGAEPARCAAFEDSHNGSLAAVAAGMTCVAVPNEVTESQDFGHVDLVLPSLTEVDLTALKGLARGKAMLARHIA